MSYYWSETCHAKNSYGYTDIVVTGCSGHNDYVGSKVKEYFDNVYLPTIGEFNLKEIDGYKIRLITVDELKTGDIPVWIYGNYIYWTMTPSSNNAVIVVRSEGRLEARAVHQGYDYGCVRPVINLYKSAIQN